MKPTTTLDPTTVEDLDFEPDLPCEHSDHNTLHVPEQPAAYLVAFGPCPECGRGYEALMCQSGWERFCKIDAMCNRCGWIGGPGTVARIVRSLR